MYCPWCGALVEEQDAKFCPDCGKPLDVDAITFPENASTSTPQVSEAEPDAQPGQGQSQVGEDARPQGGSPKGTPNRKPGHHRRASVYAAAAAVVVAALALGLVVWNISSGDTAPQSQDAGQSQQTGEDANANADATNDSQQSQDSASQPDGGTTTAAANDAASPSGDSNANASATSSNGQAASQPAGSGSASAGTPSNASDVDPTIARLNGWWTTFGNLPYNSYTYFKDGIGYIYSHDGEPEGTWAPQLGERVSAAQFGSDGTIIRSSVSSDAFYVLRDGEDILDYHWHDNYTNETGKLQYSGSDSLTRCGRDDVYAIPSFASSVEASVGSGQPAAQPAVDTSFQQQKPTITGWTKQPVPLGDGVIYRCAWTPIDGAEGYEVRRWDLGADGKWTDSYLETATTSYHDFGSSDSFFFGAQVRAYKTVGGSQVYTQWSDRSNFDIPEYQFN